MSVKVMNQPSFRELRAVLWEGIQALAEGKTTPANLNATNNAVGGIMRTVKVELEIIKITGKQPNMPELLGSGEQDSNVTTFRKTEGA